MGIKSTIVSMTTQIKIAPLPKTSVQNSYQKTVSDTPHHLYRWFTEWI